MQVSILMGSDSDWPLVKKTADTLKRFGVVFDVRVLSAHRTPDRLAEYIKTAETAGTLVFIGAAGKAAHLAGVIAAHTVLPVIGLPVKSSALDGLDALLSTVQMPAGVPVATVAIDGAENAAILAVQILAVGSDTLREKLEEHRRDMSAAITEKDAALWKQLNETV